MFWKSEKWDREKGRKLGNNREIKLNSHGEEMEDLLKYVQVQYIWNNFNEGSEEKEMMCRNVYYKNKIKDFIYFNMF